MAWQNEAKLESVGVLFIDHAYPVPIRSFCVASELTPCRSFAYS
jgi:hypothetical protein